MKFSAVLLAALVGVASAGYPGYPGFGAQTNNKTKEPSSKPSSQPSGVPSTSPRPSKSPAPSAVPTLSLAPSASPSDVPSSSPVELCKKDANGKYPTAGLLILRKGESHHKNTNKADDVADIAEYVVAEEGAINKTGNNHKKNDNNNDHKKNNNSEPSILQTTSCHNFLVKNLPHNKNGILKLRCDQEGLYDLGSFDTGLKVRDICQCECKYV